MKYLFSLALMLLMSSSSHLFAQINKPSLSPQIVKETSIGLAKLKLVYGQPNKQDRPIFGALIPYGKIWRTGANSSTKITVDRDVRLANQPIPAGTYGLYTIPGEKNWTVIIHKNAKLWGAGGYDSANDLVRFTIPVTPLKDKLETLTIHCENFHANGGDLVIAWEQTKIKIPVFVDSDAIVFKEIETKIVNATDKITAQTYFDAAQFYYHKGKDHKQAATWFEKAIELRPKAFWYKYYRAELAYEQSDLPTAKRFLAACLEQAKGSTSSDFGYLGKCALLAKKIEEQAK